MSVLKRNAAVIVVAGLVLGGAGVAWAGGAPARPTVLAASAAQTGETPPSSTPATPKAPLTDAERQAKREAMRACLEAAGEDAAARRACVPVEGMKDPGHQGKRPGHHGPIGGLPLLGKAVHGNVVVPGATEGTWQTVTFDRGKVDAATDGSTIVLARPDGETVTIALGADTKYHGIADAARIKEGEPAMVVSRDGTATHVVQRDPKKPRHPRPVPTPGNNGDVPVVPND